MHCPFYRFFTKMPSEHYMVEAHLLLGVAAEDIPHADEIRTILKV
jgi:GINS complex subunit 2